MERSRRADGLTVRLFLIVVGASIGVAGLLGGLLALWRGQNNASIALGYYVIGCLVVIAGGFPTGGLALIRGRMTRRTPTGASGFAFPSLLLGAILIGVGFLIDAYHPF